MPDSIQLEIKGIEKIVKAFNKFPRQIEKYLGQAGDETAKRVILKEKGLQRYPPMTAANQPPPPYYIRGRGTQTTSGNLLNSERLGTKWTTRQEGLNTHIGNSASYAPYVHGDKQAHFMETKGWRKLFDVAKEKVGDINRVYGAWVHKLIKDLGL